MKALKIFEEFATKVQHSPIYIYNHPFCIHIQMSIYLFNLNKVEIYHRGVYSDSLLLISFIYLHVYFIKTKERMDYMYLDCLCNIKTVWS